LILKQTLQTFTTVSLWWLAVTSVILAVLGRRRRCGDFF
jgi:hypothetical protein